MSDARAGASGSGSRTPPRSEDLRSSVSRLERAVDELMCTTREQVSDRAAALIEETTSRLERELDRRQGKPAAGRDEHAAERADYNGRYRYRYAEETAPRRLYRDPAREKIGGVCAGIARYYQMEPWVVRCIAVTALLFFPTIVFPAYWIAYFVMDKPPKPDAPREADPGRRGSHGRHDHRSPAPELGPRFSPRYSLRNVQADLTEVELRLRRMETHVTSGQYELQRELHKIDGGRDG